MDDHLFNREAIQPDMHVRSGGSPATARIRPVMLEEIETTAIFFEIRLSTRRLQAPRRACGTYLRWRSRGTA